MKRSHARVGVPARAVGLGPPPRRFAAGLRPPPQLLSRSVPRPRNNRGLVAVPSFTAPFQQSIQAVGLVLKSVGCVLKSRGHHAPVGFRAPHRRSIEQTFVSILSSNKQFGITGERDTLYKESRRQPAGGG